MGSLDWGSTNRRASYPYRTMLEHRKKGGYTSIPPMGFEPTNQLFERSKAFHALHLAATVIRD